MKSILPLLILLASANALAQVSFQKGFIVNNDNTRIECLVKEKGKRKSLEQFEYRLDESSPIQIGTLASIAEFGVGSTQKWKRAVVKIDQSSDQLEQLTLSNEPIWKLDTVFLKVLVEGKASLYEFRHLGKAKAFFSVDNGQIEQLVYKRYYSSANLLSENKEYLRQLKSKLVCREMTIDLDLKYELRALAAFFTDYNACHSSEVVVYKGERKLDLNLRLTPRLNFSSMSCFLNTGISTINQDFDQSLNVGYAAELELVLPFNHNKWSIFLEPGYRMYYDEVPGTNSNNGSKIDYTSLEVQIGLRHYFYLNSRSTSRIFVNLGAALDLPMSSSLQVKGNKLTVDTSINGSFGIGYSYRKFSLEGRFFSIRHFVSEVAWSDEFKNKSIVLGYKLF
jgi:hypothetical protein